jgi:hypothetical protein
MPTVWTTFPLQLKFSFAMGNLSPLTNRSGCCIGTSIGFRTSYYYSEIPASFRPIAVLVALGIIKA